MSVHYSDNLITLHHGHALDVAKTLPTASVQTIVTSPPYFGLRDYGQDGQIGAEETVDEYVSALVALFAELRRVLADDGTLWLNLGDSYSGRADAAAAATFRRDRAVAMTGRKNTSSGLGVKQMLGVPWRVAFALQADGWILRSEIIWAKPNPMPESVTDRPTKSHEHLFLLAKSPRYVYDAEAIQEPDAGQDHARSVLSGQASLEPSGGLMSAHGGLRKASGRNGEGRNKRDVWTVPTTPFPESHFAVYPPELIRPCIIAGSRRGDTVLDPFSGSGTTGMVATQEGRRFVGIDLSADYLDLSLRTRFQQPVLDMTGGAA
ncbi:site-specific DNA-methyltransferase [Microbacterium sp. BH-3-3-3]|uniref:DNA-methyltransferase n=1 Tax=Microbacterium sp. BH-3-3-3 TaxID=1906742 RepID=UPI0011AA4099|nr:site-specific DNA-methyltransferase [Microbacterium sp. BH-3-3-3]